MDTETQTPENRFSQIILGIVIGIVSTLLLFLFFNLISNANKPSITIPKKVLKLQLTSPNESLATSSKTVTVSGKTGIKGVVTISLGKQSKIVESTGSSFSTSLNLTEGKNVVTVTAFDPNTGESQQTSREVLHLTDDLANL